MPSPLPPQPAEDDGPTAADLDAVAGWYRWVAEFEAAGSSATYEQWAWAIAADEEVLRLIAGLPSMKQQPHLLFAACRLLDAEVDTWPAFRSVVVERWAGLSATIRTRAVQTNETARCAAFLPLLAAIPGPISLIEVGASAGLCLYPDRYAYRYGDAPAVGPDSPVQIDVRCSGTVPIPTRMPDIVWRAGIDLHPLDVRDRSDVAWLDACIWPEHDERRARLHAAIGIVAEEPPRIETGDLVEGIEPMLREVPDGTTPVVIHSAVLAYLPKPRRAEFAEVVAGRDDVVWLSNELPDVVRGLTAPPVLPDGPAVQFLVGVDGERVAAVTDPHGTWLHWVEG
jgi:hypothetical protein